MILWAYSQFLDYVPTTLDIGAWHFPYGFVTLSIFAAVVLFAFRT